MILSFKKRGDIIKTLFLLGILFFSFSDVKAAEIDIFKVAQKYGETLSEEKSVSDSAYIVEVIEDGISMEELLNSFVDESVFLVDNNYDNLINDSVSNNIVADFSQSNNQLSDYSSYFANAKDFTDINVSRRDAVLNKWASVNPLYDNYDTGEPDDITIIATAYTASIEECGKDDGITASGKLVSPGCIAAPRDIPFGTKIRVSGLGVFNVEDRGGAIVRVSDNIIKIDIWMESYNEAIKFGKRIYKGKILN